MKAHYVLLLLALILASCVPGGTPTPTPSPTPAPTPSPVPTPGSTSVAPLELVVWVPDTWLAALDTPLGQALQQQLRDFETQNPDYTVTLRIKKATGTAGILDWLASAREVAPSVLPDLVLMDQTILEEVYPKGLLAPLTLAPERRAAWPAVIQTSLQSGEAWYAVPYLLDFEHALLLPQANLAPPLTWEDLLTDKWSLLLAAGAADQADPALVAWYLSTGAAVTDERGNPLLERKTLETVYSFIRTLQNAEILDPALARSLTDAQACWELFERGRGSLSVAPAGLYWNTPEASGVPLALPGITAPAPVPVTRLWVWAQVNQHPAHQQAALALLDWLTAPEQVSVVGRVSQLVPADRTAVGLWELPAEKESTLLALMDMLYVFPSPLVERSIRRALQAGLVAMLDSPAVTPAMAASIALARLRE